MNDYEIHDMIIDHHIGEEYVTTDFTYNNKEYSITFKKSDLEIINSWVFENHTSFPANLPEKMIDSIREVIKKQIN